MHKHKASSLAKPIVIGVHDINVVESIVLVRSHTESAPHRDNGDREEKRGSAQSNGSKDDGFLVSESVGYKCAHIFVMMAR